MTRTFLLGNRGLIIRVAKSSLSLFTGSLNFSRLQLRLKTMNKQYIQWFQAEIFQVFFFIVTNVD